MQETQVQSPSQEDPQEEEMATHSSVLAWESPWTEDPGGYSPCGHKESDRTERWNHTTRVCVCVGLLHGTAHRILVPQPGVNPTPAAVGEQCVHHLTTVKVPIIQDFYCPTCPFPLMAMGFLRPRTSLYITGSSIVPGTQPEGNAFC